MSKEIPFNEFKLRVLLDDPELFKLYLEEIENDPDAVIVVE